ncbi:S8 family serine peptidase [Deltaproteobacteria bacterium]|nr:S8 family serine peptidase [Deltaproteobacteria bacterium]
MARNYFLIGLLSLFFLSSDTLSSAFEKEILQQSFSGSLTFKADLLSQKLNLKNSGLEIKDRKIGPRLNRYLSRKVTGAIREESKDNVRIILNMSGDVDSISERIKSYGARVLKKRGNMAALEIPADNIENMVTDIEEIKHARLPLQFFHQAEISEGVNLTGATEFHDAGFKGAGVKVAVIDSGFKELSEAQENGDIPYSAVNYDFTLKGIETEYLHGTACAEIVHDMAPQAELHLLKVSDEVDILNALDYCEDNDIDIISLSLSTFGSGPGNGTGLLDELFNYVRANGILVVASAGNYANGAHWEGVFSDSDNDDVHEFLQGDPGSFYNAIAAFPTQDDDGNPETNEVTILMRWDDWINSNIDYDFFLFDYHTGAPIEASDAVQDGSGLQPPLEAIVFDIPDHEDYQHNYALIVSKKSGEPAGTELEIFLGGTSRFVAFYPYPTLIATSSSSIAEPADAAGVLAVGAIDYMNWLSGPQEIFSSQGPTNAWAGSIARIKPDIMGPDGVTSFTYGISSFLGTSAAAPHVAGAAALILSMNPNLSPDELQLFIESGAFDMGETGKDNIYGRGRLNISIPVVEVNEVGNSGGGGGGGCFIATAAFGSPMEPQVKILRDIRDNYMLTNKAGKAFVTFYYRYSPPLADFIANHESLRTLVRYSLLPLVWISWLILHFGQYETTTLFILLFVLIGITSILVIRKHRIRKSMP